MLGRAGSVYSSNSEGEAAKQVGARRTVPQLLVVAASNLSVTRLVGVIVVALLSLSTGSVGLAQPLFAPCCDVPSADSCLYRFSRSGDGTIEAGHVERYPCTADSALRALTTVSLRLTPNPRCDELRGMLPAQLVLRASGRLTRRSDGFSISSDRPV